jgi:hypothetical protein
MSVIAIYQRIVMVYSTIDRYRGNIGSRGSYRVAARRGQCAIGTSERLTPAAADSTTASASTGNGQTERCKYG